MENLKSIVAELKALGKSADVSTGRLERWSEVFESAFAELTAAGFDWGDGGDDAPSSTAQLPPSPPAAAPASIVESWAGKGKVKIGQFVRAVEDKGMEADEATRRFLEGHSRPEIMKALAGAVAALAPKATRVAALAGGACATASDKALVKLLRVHFTSCSYSAGFSRSVDTSQLQDRAEVSTTSAVSAGVRFVALP